MKKSIPDSIRSQVHCKRNGLLFKYIRSQQWRWEHTGFDLLTATSEAVRSHAVKRKGHFVRSSGFAAQNPVRVANHSKADVFF